MIVNKIVESGVYIHTGFSVSELPVTIVNKEGTEEVSKNGKAYIYFKKDEDLFYIENTDIKDNTPKLPYGTFNRYMNPNFITKNFEVIVSEGIVDFVCLETVMIPDTDNMTGE